MLWTWWRCVRALWTSTVVQHVCWVHNYGCRADRLRLVRSGSVYVNALEDVAFVLPAVTETSTFPAVRRHDRREEVRAETVTPVAGIPSKRTMAPAEKPAPVRTTFAPPATGPVAGDTERRATAMASLRAIVTVIGPWRSSSSC